MMMDKINYQSNQCLLSTSRCVCKSKPVLDRSSGYKQYQTASSQFPIDIAVGMK